jgi:hypothetical protein
LDRYLFLSVTLSECNISIDFVTKILFVFQWKASKRRKKKMKKLFEQYTIEEMWNDPDLRKVALNRIKRKQAVEEKVNDLLCIQPFLYIHIERIAELYEVDVLQIMDVLGMNVEEFKNELNMMVSQEDMLKCGFLLKESEVADQLRDRLSGVIELCSKGTSING